MDLKMGQRREEEVRRENVRQVNKEAIVWGGGGGKKEGVRQERERNRKGETEVTRSKLMHGQLPEARRQRKMEIIDEHEITL